MVTAPDRSPEREQGVTMATVGITNGGVWWPPHVYRELEQLGFDTIWSSEHLLLWRPIFDAVTLMAGIAACTDDIEVGSAVLLFPPRHPLVLAKELSTIDHMCGGRLVVGAGGGGDYRPELEATGVATNYGRRFDEIIDVARLFWTEEWVTFHGEFFDIEHAGLMEPKPVQPGGPPILVGGRSDAAIERAVVRGNGYMPYMYHPSRVAEAYGQVRGKADELGVVLADDYRWSCFVYIAMDQDADRAWRSAHRDLSWRYNQDATKIVDKYVLSGTPEQVREGIEAYLDAGVRDLALGALHPHSLVQNAMPDADQTKAAVEHFHLIAEELLPLIQAAGR